MNNLLKVLLVLILAFSAGCAYLNTYRENLNINDGTGVTMDIKQRAILVSKEPYRGLRVCAEPSPEALSAYAAQLAAEVNIPESVQAKLASAFGEGSSFVGLRTQSIQLLRDTSYRLCEAHMNGALSRSQYSILLRRYQKYTVALLAIEQLTGTLRVPPVAISTAGKAEAARSLNEMMAEIETIDKKIAGIDEDLKSPTKASGELEKQIKDIDSQLTELKKKPEENKDQIKSLTDKKNGLVADKEKADDKITNLTAQRTKHQENKKMIGEGIKNSRGLLADVATNVVISPLGSSNKPSNEQVEEVSEAVHQIVRTIIETDDTGQLCIAFFGGEPDYDIFFPTNKQTELDKARFAIAKANHDGMLEMCNKHFDAIYRAKLHAISLDEQKALLIRQNKDTKAIDKLIDDFRRRQLESNYNRALLLAPPKQ